MSTAVSCSIYLNSWVFDKGRQHFLKSSEGLFEMSSAACAWKVEGGIIGFPVGEPAHLPGFAMVKIKGYFWIRFGGFEVVALLVSVSIAHVRVMKVNYVTQDCINEIYIL